MVLDKVNRIIITLLLFFAGITDAGAVLKEKNIDNTLGILRTELTTTHRELAQQSLTEQERTKEVFAQLINITSS